MATTDRDLIGGHWWRATEYVVSDGMIRPAPRATVSQYDPWADYTPGTRRSEDAPYRTLLTLLPRWDIKPRERDLAEWCSEHGLLGVLLHRTREVVFAAGQVRVPVLRRRPHSVGQVVCRRTHWGWQYLGRPPSAPRVECGVQLQDLRTARVGEREPFGKTWARFFPSVPRRARETYPYPLPLTPTFWTLYAEPINDFLDAAKAIREALEDCGTRRNRDRLNRGLRTLNALVDPIGPSLRFEGGRFQHRWRAPALLTSLAQMVLQDLTGGGRVAACAACRSPFVVRAYQERFCTRRCRRRDEGRRPHQPRKAARRTPDHRPGIVP